MNPRRPVTVETAGSKSKCLSWDGGDSDREYKERSDE